MPLRNFADRSVFTSAAMNPDERDELWRLLGKARSAKASPFFSRNVLRAIRTEQQESSGIAAWLRRRWLVGAVAGCAAVLVTFGLFQQSAQRDPFALLAQEVSASPDYAVISHLDELLASEESSVWLDSSVY